MSEVENQAVEVPATEAAPAEEIAPTSDTKIDAGVINMKKVDKKSLIAKLKTIIKRVLPSKKDKAAATTEEPASEAVEPAPAAHETTAAA